MPACLRILYSIHPHYSREPRAIRMRLVREQGVLADAGARLPRTGLAQLAGLQLWLHWGPGAGEAAGCGGSGLFLPLESVWPVTHSSLYRQGKSCPLLGRDSLNKLGTSLFLGQNEVQEDREFQQNASLGSPKMTCLLVIKIFPGGIKEQENSVVWDTSVPGRVSPDGNKIKAWGKIPGRNNIL